MKKCAIFGGSFDPPHLCHEKAVCKCIEELDLDTLFVVPTYVSPFKEKFNAPPELRYEWLRRVFEKYEKVEVLDWEIKKQRAVCTIETVKQLIEKPDKQSCDKIFLIIGSDNLQDFPKWHEYEQLLKLTEPIVISRGVTSLEYKTIMLECDFSSTRFRESLDYSMLPIEIRDSVKSFYKGKN
jgi:nicotinate-nucleotide adenylyltransferase